jgi:hypothetical protein
MESWHRANSFPIVSAFTASADLDAHKLVDAAVLSV